MTPSTINERLFYKKGAPLVFQLDKKSTHAKLGELITDYGGKVWTKKTGKVPQDVIRIFGSSYKAKEPGCISVEFLESCIEENKLLPLTGFELKYEADYFNIGLSSKRRSRSSASVEVEKVEDVNVATSKKAVKTQKNTTVHEVVEQESDGEPMDTEESDVEEDNRSDKESKEKIWDDKIVNSHTNNIERYLISDSITESSQSSPKNETTTNSTNNNADVASDVNIKKLRPTPVSTFTTIANLGTSALRTMTNIFSLGSPEKTQATKVMVEYASAVPVSEEESPSLKSRKRPFATLTNDEQDVAKEHERSSPLKSTYTYDDFLMEEKNASEQDTGKRNRENQVVSSDEDLNIKETSVKVTYQNDLSPNSQQRTQDLKTLRKQEKTPPSPKKYVYLSKLYPSDFSGYDHDEQEKHTKIKFTKEEYDAWNSKLDGEKRKQKASYHNTISSFRVQFPEKSEKECLLALYMGSGLVDVASEILRVNFNLESLGDRFKQLTYTLEEDKKIAKQQLPQGKTLDSLITRAKFLGIEINETPLEIEYFVKDQNKVEKTKARTVYRPLYQFIVNETKRKH